MILPRKLRAAGMAILMTLPFVLASGQTKHLFVTLHVKHDGKTIPSPERVTLAFGPRSLTLHRWGGRFEVPSSVLEVKNIHLLTTIGDEQIRVSGIDGNEFRQDEWTLLLADRQYDDDNQWVVPKSVPVRSSCIVLFESEVSEGTALFEPHCRFASRSKAERSKRE